MTEIPAHFTTPCFKLHHIGVAVPDPRTCSTFW